jgi:hypothetical protein
MLEKMNKKVASSPERHTFQVDGAKRRAEETGEEVPEQYLEFWKTAKQQDEENLVDPKWQKNNMEYDLRSSKELCDKVKANDNYAQNLYAAMCNQDWQSREFWQELKGETWSCSWRHSGGIVADMQERGDYIDWYCSGIGNAESGYGLDHYEPTPDPDGRDYVPEGVVTEEIELDLNRLGWRPVPSQDTLDD